ncbi:MAG: amidohydrolase family protein [Deltaproteobacteria bacterium]|nr:amidohydrolase family protein [Deltaproteobacteria bacterium]
MHDSINRRDFGKLMMLSAAGLVAGCWGGDTGADAAQLQRQMREEAERSGRGPYGALRYRGYRGLAQLPYFALDQSGQLRLRLEGMPPALDFHTHLGVALLFAPALDLQRRTERTQYFLDCDRDQPGCDFDLDVYINTNFSRAAHDELEREIRNQLLFGSRAAQTHTVPNLLAEMDAMGVAQANVLAIATGLPFGDNLTDTWLQAIEQAGADRRLLLFASVHPHSRTWRQQLRQFAGRGARGLKLHPEMQRFFPDDPAALEVYDECERLGLPVIFHAGRSGIEPNFMRPYALIRHLVKGIEAFPRVQFVLGHAGARDVAEGVALAQRHANVWLEIASQGVTQLHDIIGAVGAERVLFGSDWPFYPLAATLAKVLLVTEGQPEARAAILRGNAERVFAAAAANVRHDS